MTQTGQKTERFAGLDWLAGSMTCRQGPGRRIRQSAPLARAAAVERDNLALGRSVGAVLRKLLGNAQKQFTALHLSPYVFGVNASGGPEHHEVVEQIGALAHDQIGMAVHG